MDSVSIQCTDDSSCSGTEIHGQSGSSSVSLECRGDATCGDVRFYCPLTSECSVYCNPNATSPCDSTYVYIYDDGSYNDSLFSVSCEFENCALYEYLCTDSSYTKCTVTSLLQLTLLECNQTDHCHIECIEEDCSARYIDGSAATSMTVNCSTGCTASHFICP